MIIQYNNNILYETEYMPRKIDMIYYYRYNNIIHYVYDYPRDTHTYVYFRYLLTKILRVHHNNIYK